MRTLRLVGLPLWRSVGQRVKFVACKVSIGFAAFFLMAYADSALADVMTAEMKAAIKAIGPVIDPPATAKLYTPLHQKEPYKGVQVVRDERYGESERNRLDLFLPERVASARPVLIYIHGGGYLRGDKRLTNDSPYYDNVMLWATSQGYVGVNMTYRLAPDYKWPAGAKDVASVVAWTKANIQKYGGNPNRIFLMGHSTGAVHIAGYIASADFQMGTIAGAILISGTYSLKPDIDIPGQKAYFGEDTNYWQERSSLAGVEAANVALFVAHGEVDAPYYIAQSDELTAALCAAKRCPTHAVLAGHSHMSEMYSLNTADTTLARPLNDFIRDTKGY